MYRKSIAIFILFLCTACQKTAPKNPITLTSDSDTVFFKKLNDKLFLRLKKPLVANLNSKYVFRFKTECYYVELVELNNKTTGKLTFFVNDFDPNLHFKKEIEAKEKRLFIKDYNLNTTQINGILNLIETAKIKSIPSDKYIPSRKKGLDGTLFYIEIKDENRYSFKKYWSPELQKNCNEAVAIQNFIQKLSVLVDFEKNSKDFEKQIPFSKWICCGSLSGGEK